jgi:zinc protease
VLGSGDSCLLWQSVREKARLVHVIDAHCWNPGQTGLFSISFTCEPSNREKAVRAVLAELAKVAKRGCPAGLLRKAVRQLVVGEINAQKTMSGQASQLGSAEVVAGELAFSRGFFELICRVRPADLARVARFYLIASRMTQVSSNPPASVSAPPHLSLPCGQPSCFEEIRLKNGARIVHQVDRRLPQLHIRMLCHGGPMHEQAGLRGASSLLATMITKDTRRHSASDVASFIEEAGGSFGPVTGNNSMGCAVEVLAPDWKRAVRVLGEALLIPSFLPSTLEIEREAQLAALKQDDDDVVSFGKRQLRRRFFGSYGLSVGASGDAEGVKAVSPADLEALRSRLLIAGNVVLAVSGDYDPSVLLPQLKRILQQLPSGKSFSLPPVFEASPRADWEEKQQREQAVVFQAYPGPGLLNGDFFVGEVADELFSGMASRLFERVREEKGLAYFVRSSRVTGLRGAMFSFQAGTAPDKVSEVLSEIESEVARVADCGVEEAELRRCQTRLKAGRRQGMQMSGVRALNAGLNVLFGLPVNDANLYDSRIDAVTIPALGSFARRYLRREFRTRLVVRP